MAMRIKEYDSIPRIALVRYSWNVDSKIREQSNEVMVLEKRKLTFISGFEIALEDDAYAHLSGFLSDGDIVTINKRGFLRKLFDAEEHNATILITGECNSNCVMCPSSEYERKRNSGLPDEWLMKYINLLPKDVPHIVVTGGEPTLIPHRFFMVMESVANHLPRAETLLLTNGRSLASQHMLRSLLNYCPPYLTVGIPIHGHDATLHDAITQADGSFRQTCMGIDNLLDNRIAVEVRVVVSKLNAKNLDSITDLIIQRFPQVNSVKLMGLEVLGSCAKNFEKTYISNEESWVYIESAVMRLLSRGIPVQLYNFPLCAIKKGFWTICKKSITPSKVRFTDGCMDCVMKSQCGGFFVSTLNRTRPRVHPICVDE